MEPAKRIVVNTLAQHTRSVINTCLSLYSTRLVLQALGQSDFGIYFLVAGVVIMLSFLTGAMVVTTQRQLSFYQGKGDAASVKAMFSTSLLLHILFGIVLAAILIALSPFIFNSLLDIAPDRLPIAEKVYYLAILSLFISFIVAPYKALFIAHEEIYYVSLVDIIDGILKLAFAFFLFYISFDRLLAYAWAIAGIMAFNYIALSLWGVFHFRECVLLPKLRLVGRRYLRELTSFATWTVYSTGCIMARTQGVAILLNRFFGTIVNSSYGIAMQMFNSISFIAMSVINAMSPQIVKAEGTGDRQRMLRLSELLSKYAFLLLSTVTIPLAFEMPQVLHVWLGDVPPHAVSLCRFVIITALCDQITIGLGTANQAIGRIRNYTLTVSSIKVLTLPAFWLCLYLGFPIETAMWTYLGFEIVCALVRLPFLKLTAGLSIRHFANHVFLRVAIPLAALSLACFAMITYVQMPLRFLLTGFVSVLVAGVTIWFFALEQEERANMLRIIKR